MTPRVANIWHNREATATGRWLLLSSMALVLAGCGHWGELPGKPKPEDRPKYPDEILDFGTLYKTNCRGCHGEKGNLGPAPPLNDKIFLAIVPDNELEMVVTEGRHDTLMPAWSKNNGGPITAEQAKILAAGIKRAWGSGNAPNDTPTYLPDPKVKGNVPAGAKVYARACASCHGDSGQGGEFGKKKIGGLNDRAFLGLISDQALRRLVITGRPDLGMPAFNQDTNRGADFKPLTSQDVADLVALLASWRVSNTDK